MNFDGFLDCRALESDENLSLKDLTTAEDVGFGIVKRHLKIKTTDEAKRLGKPIGVYTTFDCTESIYSSARAEKAIERLLISAIKSFVCGKKRILVVGLGNGRIAADSLGEKVFDKIEVCADKSAKSAYKHSVYAVSTSVFGKTGIESADVVFAIVNELKPSAVMLIDSFATGSVARLGKSFQLTTAGLSPGGGVGNLNTKIDKDLLGVPVLAIGVPTLLTLSSTVVSVLKEYLSHIEDAPDVYLIRSILADKKASDLLVAPKDIDVLVENASVIVANSLNLAFAD